MGKLIVLASSSPRRQELLRKLGLPLRVVTREVDEGIPEGGDPSGLVRMLALRKARAVVLDDLVKSQPSVIIGADTVVVCDSRILGKPRDEDEACRMLKLLQGRAHEVLTGVALHCAPSGEEIVFHEKTTVRFRAAGRQEIEGYVKTGEPLDKAGAYGIQGLGSIFIEAIEGCFFNVVGLPISRLVENLKVFNIRVF
ncbi:MAG TPA: Maf family protein [Clostridia bacterium]|nr:Maf family protein [Clostridia bacterium]